MQNDEKRIAVFIDFENVAMGVRESKHGNFDVDLVLKRLVEKGKIMVKRAYSDWHRYAEFKRAFHQAAIELIDVPQTRYSGKNSADIRMVVDALDLSYQKDHIDTFVLVSGDSDFSPLVSKLRENGRYVIGMGVKQSSSDLLVNNCDEFIYYEDLVRPNTAARASDPRLLNLPEKKAEAMRLVLETFEALQREDKESIYGSMIKQTLIRKLPSFSESYYGYPTFSRLLEDVAENKLLKLTKDQKSGGYIVTGINEGGQPTTGAVGVEGAPEAASGAESVTPRAAAPATGGAEIRDFQRRSRWGRNRWSRGSLRPSPTTAPREAPVQKETTESAAEGKEEPVLPARETDVQAAPLAIEPASLPSLGAVQTSGESATSPAAARPAEPEPKAPDPRVERGRGRRGRGTAIAEHFSQKVPSASPSWQSADLSEQTQVSPGEEARAAPSQTPRLQPEPAALPRHPEVEDKNLEAAAVSPDSQPNMESAGAQRSKTISHQGARPSRKKKATTSKTGSRTQRK
jgi:uncharacterized protein (TIGR00288 family)